MAKKAYIGVGEKYTVVDYIESTGTQYIDTSFVPNNNSCVIMDAEFLSTPDASSWLFGCRSATSSQVFDLLWLASGSFRSGYNETNTQLWQIDATTRRTYKKDKETTTIDGTAQSYENTAFDCAYNLYLMALNSKGSPSGYATVKLYSCKIYDNGTLIRDFVPCVSDEGTAGLFDRVSQNFYGNAGTGGFAVGTQTGEAVNTASVARKVKKIYLGVDGTARKVKKGYIGVGGVARPFWTGGELAYYGETTSLSVARYYLGATTVGNYALFGGGCTKSTSNSSVTYRSTVDAYDKSLTISKPTDLSVARYPVAATSIGNYALFGGGYNGGLKSSVDAYDTSLTRSAPTALSVARQNIGATSIGDYALFGGGYYASAAHTNTVDAYNKSLTRSTPTVLSQARGSLAATSIGDYALFGGGETGTSDSQKQYTTVDAYNASLTRSLPTVLSHARTNIAATSVGNYALFGGGGGGGRQPIVDAYNKSLTRSTPTVLSKGRQHLGATTVGGYALFGGGTTSVNYTGNVNTVDAYDESLTRTIPTTLSKARMNLEATTVGDYALFGGGLVSSTENGNVVDVYTVS